MAAGGGVCGSVGSASRSAVLKAPGDSRKLWRPGLSLAGVRDCSRADRGPSRGERALSFSAGEKLSLVAIRTRGFPVNPQLWTDHPLSAEKHPKVRREKGGYERDGAAKALIAQASPEQTCNMSKLSSPASSQVTLHLHAVGRKEAISE